MTDLPKELRGMVYSEIAIVCVTALTAIFQAWGLFAAFALMCILVPLWIAAIAAVFVAMEAVSQGDDKGERG